MTTLHDILSSYKTYLRPRRMEPYFRRISIWFQGDPTVTRTSELPTKVELAQHLRNVITGANPGAQDVPIDGGTLVFRLGRFDDVRGVNYSCSGNGLYFLQSVPMTSEDIDNIVALREPPPSHISLHFAFQGKERIQSPHYTTYFVSEGKLGSERGYGSTVYAFGLPSGFEAAARGARTTVHDLIEKPAEERGPELDEITRFVNDVKSHMSDTVKQMSGGGESSSDVISSSSSSVSDDIDEQLVDIVGTYVGNRGKFRGVEVFYSDDAFLAVVNAKTDDAIYCTVDDYVIGPSWLSDSHSGSAGDPTVFKEVSDLYAAAASRGRIPPSKRQRTEHSSSMKRGGANNWARVLSGTCLLVACALLSMC